VTDGGHDFEWDEAKAAGNLVRHGVTFDGIRRFEWDTCATFEDRRTDYGEVRFVSHGLIADRLHVAIRTMRGGRCRLISLRKANGREIRAFREGSLR
jgi:uncharacterized DUF497 family protein